MEKLSKVYTVLNRLAAKGCTHRVGSQYREAYISIPAGAPVSLKYVDAVSLAGQYLLEDRTRNTNYMSGLGPWSLEILTTREAWVPGACASEKAL